MSFGRPDPIEEFAQKLKSTGSKEDYRLGRKVEIQNENLLTSGCSWRRKSRC